MGLKDLRSNLDIYGGNQAISQGGNPGGFLSNAQPPFDGGANLATGPLVGERDYDYDFYRDSGNTDSPFDYPKGREGLNGEKSSLFFEFYRLLKECNPKYYLLENVLMNQQSYINLSDIMKCYPVEICSSKVSAQIRKRLYWTNIKTKKDFFGFETVDIPQPDDKNIFFQDIITTGYADKLKSRCLNTKSYIPSEKSEYIWKRYNTTGMLSLIFFN